MARQEHFYNQFINILKISEQRDFPNWLYENIERGVYLASYEYADYNRNQEWNNRFFINDRYENRSFIGGIAELAWVLSHTDDELRTTLPCLTKEEQVDKALDFFSAGKSYQLKTVEHGSFGDLQVRYEYLETTADYLVLIDADNAKAYTHTPAMWDAIKQTSYRDNGRKMFWAHPSAVLSTGGTERDLPEFIKQAKPQRSIA